MKLNPDKLAERWRSLVCPQVRGKVSPVDEDGNGWIEGYLAVFGNTDQGNEIVEKGIFAKSASERIPAGRVPLITRHFMYGGDIPDIVGLITGGQEDGFGLFVHAKFSGIQRAQETRQLINEGIVWGLSVGFELLRFEESKDADEKSVIRLLEAKLSEGTITVRPMNERAVITGAKSGNPAENLDFEHFSLDQLRQIKQNVTDALNDLQSKAKDGSGFTLDAEAYLRHGQLQQQAITLAKLGV